MALARILEDAGGVVAIRILPGVGHEVDGPIVVVVGADCRDAAACIRQPCALSYIRECSVTVIAPQGVGRFRAALWPTSVSTHAPGLVLVGAGPGPE